MKEICLIWFRGWQLPPSLLDRRSTCIWNLAHAISNPRAEISGMLVMVRCSSTTSRGGSYWFPYFVLLSRIQHLRMCRFCHSRTTRSIQGSTWLSTWRWVEGREYSGYEEEVTSSQDWNNNININNQKNPFSVQFIRDSFSWIEDTLLY